MKDTSRSSVVADLENEAPVIFRIFYLPDLRGGVHMTRDMMPAYLISHAC